MKVSSKDGVRLPAWRGNWKPVSQAILSPYAVYQYSSGTGIVRQSAYLRPTDGPNAPQPFRQYALV